MGSVTSQEIARGGRAIDTIVTDYLSALIYHLAYMLREKLGPVVLKDTPMEFVVTVPAIWSDKAKDRTKRACQEAVKQLAKPTIIRPSVKQKMGGRRGI